MNTNSIELTDKDIIVGLFGSIENAFEVLAAQCMTTESFRRCAFAIGIEVEGRAEDRLYAVMVRNGLASVNWKQWAKMTAFAQSQYLAKAAAILYSL
jgi:hypothetical protein